MKVKTLAQFEAGVVAKSSIRETIEGNSSMEDAYTLGWLYSILSTMIGSFTEEEKEKYKFYLEEMYDEDKNI